MPATIHYVPAGGSIQAAIDAADPPDTVMVACATFSISWPLQMKSGIYLTSETGQADCATLDSGNNNRVMGCYSVDNTTTIKGFTFTRGHVGSYPLENMGAGMRCWDSSPAIINCWFYDNYSGGMGGGLHCENQSSPTIRNCLFSDNQARFGAGMYCSEGAATLEDCTFYDNLALEDGGGMCISEASPTVTNCTFVENYAWSGAGIFCAYGSPYIDRTIIAFSTNGGAALCYNCTATFIHCCSHGNVGGDTLCGTTIENLYVDPLFCDLEAQDWTLHADSPCLPENNPYDVRIGAWGQGCPATSVESGTTWGCLKAMWR